MTTKRKTDNFISKKKDIQQFDKMNKFKRYDLTHMPLCDGAMYLYLKSQSRDNRFLVFILNLGQPSNLFKKSDTFSWINWDGQGCGHQNSELKLYIIQTARNIITIFIIHSFICFLFQLGTHPLTLGRVTLNILNLTELITQK